MIYKILLTLLFLNLGTCTYYIDPTNPYCVSDPGPSCTCSSSPSNTYYKYGSECIAVNSNENAISNNAITLKCDENCATCSPNGKCTTCRTNPTFLGDARNDPSTGPYTYCDASCNYFTKSYSLTTTTNQPQQPQQSQQQTSTSQTTCSTCTDQDAATCIAGTTSSKSIDCTYSKARFTGSVSAINISNGVDCSSASSRTTPITSSTDYSKIYYLTPEDKDCSTSGICDGTIDKPYDDINIIMKDLIDNFHIHSKTKAKVTIYLMRSGTNIEHFWLDSGINVIYQRLFERTAVDVTITSATCSDTSKCFSGNDRPIVYIKSFSMSIHISWKMTLYNVIFDGSELIPPDNCYENNKSQREKCCNSQSTSSSLPLSLYSDAQCCPTGGSCNLTSNMSKTSLKVPYEYYDTSDLWPQGPYSFFVLTFLSDWASVDSVPQLTIENCEFNHFWYHKYYRSFIYIDPRGGKLIIKDSSFKNFNFPYGLITNTKNSIERDNIYTKNLIPTKSKYSELDCGVETECNMLNITNTTFQDSLFGSYSYSYSSSVTLPKNIGSVLFLYSFDGPIYLIKNTFKKISNMNYVASQEASSGNGQSGGGGGGGGGGSESGGQGQSSTSSSTSAYTCSSKDSITISGFPHSIDKIIQAVIGTESTTSSSISTSSVLQIRELKYGLTIYDNTFQNNIADTGTNLLLHNFENDDEYPIIIEKNTFEGNFATKFGSGFAILNYARDYVTMNCGGVYINNNTFSNNIGCSYTKGVALVLCIPEKPYLSSLIQGSSTSEDSNWIKYYVSVNQRSSLGSTRQDYSNDYDITTLNVFSEAMKYKTNNKDTTSSAIHPYLGTNIDVSRMIIKNNIFKYNYAGISHLTLQGTHNLYIDSNVFEHNHFPISSFYPTDLKSLSIFSTVLGNSTYLPAYVMATPLLIRLSNYVVITNNQFKNNSQTASSSNHLTFGTAITIDRHLGAAPVNFSCNTISDNIGATNNLIYQVNATASTTTGNQNGGQGSSTSSSVGYYSMFGTSGQYQPLITYSVWTNMKSILFLGKESTPPQGDFLSAEYNATFYVTNNIIYNNIFNSTSSSTQGGGQGQNSALSATSSNALVKIYSDSDATGDVATTSTYSKFIKNLYFYFNDNNISSNFIADGRKMIGGDNVDYLYISSNFFFSNKISNFKETQGQVVNEVLGMISLEISQSSKPEVSITYNTFKNNAGQVLIGSSSLSGSETSNSIAFNENLISNHTSDYSVISLNSIQKFTAENNTILSSSVVNGAIYIHDLEDSFSLQNTYISDLTTTATGCLYLSTVKGLPYVSNFSCLNSVYKVVQTTNSEFAVISGSNPCFYLKSLTEFSITLNNLRCISSVLAYSTTMTNTNQLSQCLNINNVKSIDFIDFECIYSALTDTPSKNGNSFLGILESYSVITFNDSVFQGNKIWSGITATGGTIIMNNCIIDSNTAIDSATFLEGTLSFYLYLVNATYSNNYCSNCNGGFTIKRGTATILNSLFSNNTGHSAACLNVKLGTLNINSSIFAKNSVSVSGSTILTDLTTSNIYDCYFSSNSAGQNTITLSQGTSYFHSCIFYNNTASSRSTGIYAASQTSFFLNNVSFIGLESQSYLNIRGAFIFGFESNINVTNCSFSNGRAKQGGAIYFDSSIYLLSISNSKFQKNAAMNEGGCMYLTGQSSSTLISDSFFEENYNEGGIGSTIYSNNMIITIYNTNIQVPNYTAFHMISGSLYIDLVVLTGSRKFYSAGIRAYSLDKLAINNSIIQNFGSNKISPNLQDSDLRSAVRILDGENAVSTDSNFYNVTFSNNFDTKGSAFNLIGTSKANFVDCTFDGNGAYEGGAIYYDSTYSTSSILVSGNTVFKNNYASKAGGAIKFVNRNINFENSTGSIILENNTSPYGNNIASYGVKIQQIQSDSSIYTPYVYKKDNPNSRLLQDYEMSVRNLDLSTYSSGDSIYPPIMFSLLDEYGQIVTTDSSATVGVSTYLVGGNTSYPTPTWSGDNPFTAFNGYFILYPLKIYSFPGTTAGLQVYLTNVNASVFGRDSSDFPQGSDSKYTNNISTRVCTEGERIDEQNSCFECSYGFFTTEIMSYDECIECPGNAICYGANVFGPLSGYWRFSSTDHKITECFNADACLGIHISDDSVRNISYCQELHNNSFCYTGWCAQGYGGVLCTECVEGYAISNPVTNTCSACANNPNYYIYSILIVIVGIIYTIFMIKNALKEDKSEKSKSKSKNNTIKEVEKSEQEHIISNQKDPPLPVKIMETEEKDDEDEEDYSAIYTKVLTNYIQLISLIGNFNFAWPNQMDGLFDSSESTSQGTSQVFSFDCVLRQPFFADMGLRSFFAKLLILTIAPIFLVVILALIWHLIYFIKYYSNFQKMKKKLYLNYVTSVVVTLFVVHPNIVEIGIQSFMCTTVGDDSSTTTFLTYDMHYQCYSSQHIKIGLILGLPCLIFWGLGIPGFAWFLLYKNRKTLDSYEMKAKLGFLYEGYKTKTFFWEFVIFYRKLLIILISTFLSDSEVMLQAALVLGLSAGCYFLQIHYLPFLTPTLNEMEKRSLVVSTVCIYCGLYFIVDVSTGVKLMFFAIICIMNAYFFIYWGVEFLKIKSKSLLKVPFLAKHFGKYLRKLSKFQWRKKNAALAWMSAEGATLKTPYEEKIVQDEIAKLPLSQEA